MDDIFLKYKHLNEAFHFENFKIANLSNSNLCYIFISGNTIPPENTNKDYYIKHKNDFEWLNISKNKKIRKNAGKIIYIKDISSKFYKNGINFKINSIDLLIEFLKEETKNYKIIICGMSAGAYLSLILGSKLRNVIKVLAFGPIYNLLTWKGANNQYAKKHIDFYTLESDQEKRKYFILDDYIPKCNYLCICGYHSIDLIQENYIVSKLESIDSIWINTNKHCGGLSRYSLILLLTKDFNTHQFAEKFKNKIIKERKILFVLSKFSCLKYLLMKAFKFILKLPKKIMVLLTTLKNRIIKKIKPNFAKKKILLFCHATQDEEHIINYYKIAKNNKYNFYISYPYNSNKLKLFCEKEKIKIVSQKLFSTKYFDLIVSADCYSRGKQQQMIPFLYINHGLHLRGRNDGNSTYAYEEILKGNKATMLFEPNKRIADLMQNEAKKYNSKIVFTGLNNYENLLTKPDLLSFTKEIGINQNKQTLLIISSWGEESIFNKYENEILKVIPALCENYNVIISLHPNFIKYEKELTDKIYNMKQYGCFFREPELDWLKYLHTADIVFSDYSSLTETSIIMKKKTIISDYDKSFIWNKSLLFNAQNFLNKVVDINDLPNIISKTLSSEFPKELDLIGEEVKINQKDFENIVRISTQSLLYKKNN